MSADELTIQAEARPEPEASVAEASVPAEKQLTNKEKRLLKKQEKAKQKAAAESNKADAEDETAVTAVEEKMKKRKRAAEGAEAEGAQDGEQQEEGAEEEEPLSHKEQRKRRKLEKQLEIKRKSLGSAGEAPASAEAKGAVKDEKDLPARSKFSVWIGNMSFRTSPQRIQEWLEEREIEGISRVHMPKGVRRGEYNKG